MTDAAAPPFTATELRDRLVAIADEFGTLMSPRARLVVNSRCGRLLAGEQGGAWVRRWVGDTLIDVGHRYLPTRPVWLGRREVRLPVPVGTYSISVDMGFHAKSRARPAAPSACGAPG
jgi:hypothetical protein